MHKTKKEYAEKGKQYYENNKEKVSEKHKQYRKDNIEKISNYSNITNPKTIEVLQIIQNTKISKPKKDINSLLYIRDLFQTPQTLEKTNELLYNAINNQNVPIIRKDSSFFDKWNYLVVCSVLCLNLFNRKRFHRLAEATQRLCSSTEG